MAYVASSTVKIPALLAVPKLEIFSYQHHMCILLLIVKIKITMQSYMSKNTKSAPLGYFPVMHKSTTQKLYPANLHSFNSDRNTETSKLIRADEARFLCANWISVVLRKDSSNKTISLYTIQKKNQSYMWLSGNI